MSKIEIHWKDQLQNKYFVKKIVHTVAGRYQATQCRCKCVSLINCCDRKINNFRSDKVGFLDHFYAICGQVAMYFAALPLYFICWPLLWIGRHYTIYCTYKNKQSKSIKFPFEFFSTIIFILKCGIEYWYWGKPFPPIFWNIIDQIAMRGRTLGK